MACNNNIAQGFIPPSEHLQQLLHIQHSTMNQLLNTSRRTSCECVIKSWKSFPQVTAWWTDTGHRCICLGNSVK